MSPSQHTIQPSTLDLSGARLRVIYHLTGDEATARQKAEAICIEQTIEFPPELVPDDDIRGHIFGRIEAFTRAADGSATAHASDRSELWQATISYAVEVAGGELTQLLNLIFGNISLMPGIKVDRLELPPSITGLFSGPRFGRAGWRKRLNVAGRPLLCSALKPMGQSLTALAEQAYRFALGGIDLIKDDHGLANQPFAPFRERVARCVEAIAQANRETGQRCLYMPNITAPMHDLWARAEFAQQAGAGALLVAPGLIGWDALRALAADDALDLPLMSHPTFAGSFVTAAESGWSHFALYGQLTRLCGADAVIYPNWGGRFAFTKAQCAAIVAGTVTPMGDIAPILPAPGGGMTLERVGEMMAVYGNEVIFLMGGGLHRHSPDLVANCRHFRALVERDNDGC